MFWGDFWVILGVPTGGIPGFRCQKLQKLQNTSKQRLKRCFEVLQFLTTKIQNIAPVDPQNDPKITTKHPPDLPVTWLGIFRGYPILQNMGSKTPYKKHLSNVFLQQNMFLSDYSQNRCF